MTAGFDPDSEWVPVRNVTTRFDAELIVSELRAIGVESRIRADDAGGWSPQLTAAGGVFVLVQKKDLGSARSALQSI